MNKVLNPEVCVSDAREMLILMCNDTELHVHVIRLSVIRAVRHSMVSITFTQIFSSEFLCSILRVAVKFDSQLGHMTLQQ